MKLYYIPAACSLASNIALREANIKFQLVLVDKYTKQADDGLDFNAVNPKGYVPALALDNGEVLTENVAVLQYIADRTPAAGLSPPTGTMERYRLLEWLGFINSELHKSFNPLFRPEVPEGAKEYARATLTTRLGYLQRTLRSDTYLVGEQFTIADAYLFTVLSWTQYVGVDIGQWPDLRAYLNRISVRPHVVAALRAEGLLK
jgi:glutathione S-transferase